VMMKVLVFWNVFALLTDKRLSTFRRSVVHLSSGSSRPTARCMSHKTRIFRNRNFIYLEFCETATSSGYLYRININEFN